MVKIQKLFDKCLHLPYFDTYTPEQQADTLNFYWEKKNELDALIKAGKWEDFANMAHSFPEMYEYTFQFWDDIPDNLKYDFAVNSYDHHGDSIPAVRRAVRSLTKYNAGKVILPQEYRGKEVITVYRAGEEPLTKARYRISWTLSKEVAEFFAYEWSGRHANHLYRAKIKPARILAYDDDREEQEVMQYMAVYDVEELEAIR